VSLWLLGRRICQGREAALGREIGEKVKKLDRKYSARASREQGLCVSSCAGGNPRYM
jgi:hypothetical protein